MDQAKWNRFCQQASEVFQNSAGWMINQNRPGNASWFTLAAEIWQAMGGSSVIAAQFYDALLELTAPGGSAVIAQASMHVSRNLIVRDHYWVLALERAALLWASCFTPGLEFPEGDRPGDRPLPVVLRDQFDRAFADALLTVRAHVLGCGCAQCVAAGAATLAWLDGLGEGPDHAWPEDPPDGA